MNKLWGFRFYLCGAMDLAKDRGIGWRKKIGPFIESFGGVVFDPTNKPIDLAPEAPEDIERRAKWKAEGKYDLVEKEMKLVRCLDLRCVDLCDALICHLDLQVPIAGTLEEIDWANRCKKPILIHFEQGKQHINDWHLGKLPNQHIFSTWLDLQKFLIDIDLDINKEHYKRFFFFNYDKLLPKRPPNTQDDGLEYQLKWEVI